MSGHDVTHKEIYDRLVAVEVKVDAIASGTKDVVAAFAAAQGAFTVLETLSKLAKPLLWIGGLVTAVVAFWDHFKVR
jgi:hypothetical protein